MKYLILDVESTTSNKGNPFDLTNGLISVGLKFVDGDVKIVGYPFDKLQNKVKVDYIQKNIDNADCLVGFNIKFDLHWLKRIGIDFSNKLIWDCQIGEFLIGCQLHPYPSLNDAANRIGVPPKLDIVKEEYWDKGIDTDKIPIEILSDYLAQDLVLTQQVFEDQQEVFQNNGKRTLFKLQCADLLVLQEMEWNGVKFDTVSARARALEIQNEIEGIHKSLSQLVGDIPINLGSNDHLSYLLFGGTLSIDFRIPIGVYKSGAKVGQTRYKIVQKNYELPRLTEPIEGTEAKKPEGSQPVWKTNEDILRSLKLNKKAKFIVDLVLKYSKLEKLRGTYLEGWSNLIDKMNWEKDTIHGNLNQCVAITGRLSSTKPNQQNADKETKTYCVSRYDN
jgi:DNA polymerase I-like protein with 3'-5' exonuclease and polymerase domains